MKRGIFRGLCIALIMLLSMALYGCNDSKQKVVSNINETKKESKLETKEKKEKENTENKKEETKKEETKIEEKKEETKEKPKEENKNVTATTANKQQANSKPQKPVDTSKYKGYKGPVQGEVKYSQGTPAGENSNEYKALGDIQSPYHVNLVVTRDFGHKKMYAKNVGLVKDEVGMEVLFRNLNVQTAYGGGFVNSINGLESGYTFNTGKERRKLDWFYWVNGILAPVGIGEFKPNSEDVIWWDYHDWSVTMFAPAVIGSYPQPFKSGFRGSNPGTVIMYTSEYEKDANSLKQSLLNKGVKQIDTVPYDPNTLTNPQKYYILLGTYNNLAESSNLIKDINTKNKLVGTYVKFENNKIQSLDFKGNVVSTHDSGGAIYAYSSGIGSTHPIWMITGTDDNGVKMAINTMINNSSSLDKCFGVVVSQKGVENVPYIY